MSANLLHEPFIPIFEDSLSFCRVLHDHFLIFGKDGTIYGSRSNDSRIGEGCNFYATISNEDTVLINELCNNFEVQWLIVDTKSGCAAIYTSLYAISRLLFAVIFDLPKEAVRRFFGSSHGSSTVISPTVAALSDAKTTASSLSAASETFELASSALSHRQIGEAKYRLGANIGKFLASRILDIANFLGCAGSCTTALDFVPSLTDFSPELFTVMSSCAILFARDMGKTRSFQARINQYKERLLISFKIDTEKDLSIYSRGRLSHNLLKICEELALERDAFFDCSVLGQDASSIALSFTIENDPIIGRRIKQNMQTILNGFWN